MEYRYVGYTLDEGIVRGRVEADNESAAREEITEQGCKLLEVRAIRQLPGIEDLFPSLFKIGRKDLVRFTQQLAIMVRGGGSLQRALELLNGRDTAAFFQVAIPDPLIRTDAALVNAILSNAFITAKVAAGEIVKNEDGTHTVAGSQ